MEGHIQTGYCNECKVNVEPNSSVEEHQRSRKHINRLLQLGLEVPISSVNHPEESQLPQDTKTAYCITCEKLVGNALQAAVHYRSREHLNRRLQRGLPVTMTQDQTPAVRDFINECLRRGCCPQPAQSSTNRMPLAAGVSRGINGKRKLPPGCPPIYSPAASSMPTNSVPQCTNFPFEKRQRRPAMSMQSQEPNYAVNNFAGQGLSFSGQRPSSNNFSPAAAAAGNSYRMHAPRMPAVTTYGSHFQLDPQLSSPVEYDWNSSYNGDYEDAKFGAGLTEGWSF